MIMRIRKNKIGSRTFTRTLGHVTVSEDLLDVFLSEGRHDLIEGIPVPKKLKAVKDSATTDSK